MPPEKLFQQLVSYVDADLSNNKSVMEAQITFSFFFQFFSLDPYKCLNLKAFLYDKLFLLWFGTTKRPLHIPQSYLIQV